MSSLNAPPALSVSTLSPRTGPAPPSVGSPLSFTHPIHFPSKRVQPSVPPFSTVYHHLKSTLPSFKFSKKENSGLFDHLMDDNVRHPPYATDGLDLHSLQQQIARTFQQRPPPPPPSALTTTPPPPTSNLERSRTNLLRWLASPMCLLFNESDDSVSVNDLELEELIREADSADDAGANVIKVLMRWSAEGRKYSTWAALQQDMRDINNPPPPPLTALQRELQQRVEAEQRRQEALNQLMAKERAERFAALKVWQEEQKQGNAERRKEREEAKRHPVVRKQTEPRPATSRPTRAVTRGGKRAEGKAGDTGKPRERASSVKERSDKSDAGQTEEKEQEKVVEEKVVEATVSEVYTEPSSPQSRSPSPKATSFPSVDAAGTDSVQPEEAAVD